MADHPTKAMMPGRRLRRSSLRSMASAIERNAQDARRHALESSIDSLREEVRTALSRTDRSREVIGRLEDENRRLRAREAERRQEPLINGVVTLFDDMRSVTEHERARAAHNEPVPAWVQVVLVFQQQVLEVLRRNDVEAVEPVVAQPVDPERHEVWEAVETDLPDRDMQVAEVIRLGFEFAGRVLRPAAVKVHRFHPALEQGALQ